MISAVMFNTASERSVFVDIIRNIGSYIAELFLSCAFTLQDIPENGPCWINSRNLV